MLEIGTRMGGNVGPMRGFGLFHTDFWTCRKLEMLGHLYLNRWLLFSPIVWSLEVSRKKNHHSW